MNILIVGSGKGSWQMRAVQLGAALGARVTSQPIAEDWHWADLAVLVKKAGALFAAAAHQAGVPVVWDALDFWKQPAENRANETYANGLLQAQIAVIKPALAIGATQAMAEACGGVCLPHHSRIGLVPTPAREDFRVIGYDGNPAYLDRWGQAIDALCRRRGWTFVVNPADLSAVDALVALRGGQWDGWICRQWKSGVKAVNAICAGRPLIAQPSAAFDELQPDGSCVETFDEFEQALEMWTSYERRQSVVERCAQRAPSFTVEALAERYHGILAGVGATCTA